MKVADYVWPVIGVSAAVFSGWLLFREIRTLSVEDLLDSFRAIDGLHWLLSGLSALVAYLALAAYDGLALRHLGRVLPWPYVAVTSFTTYALSHNIGASVFSGAMVRYRAYTARGLTGPEVGILVAFCSITFFIGIAVLTAAVLLLAPDIVARISPEADASVAIPAALLILALLGAYVLASLLHLRPLHLGPVRIVYPRPPIVALQFLVAPIEVIAAAAIIYFALPAEANPGFIVVLGIFVASFSAALLSHAPGGLGILELFFVLGLSEIPEADVLAALLIFRAFYLLIPFAISIGVVLIFERNQLKAVQAGRSG
ncbi:lysylphosphatidylglycerol synthase domain-containing protein [Chthonobacter albigriseus]|uniref:lysylphosphatidylglycerol synthase domain-containing protein n=1 Tax=Chthonobacter albigriseus TaxID=1683161 RepID=UPI0015EF9D3E